MLLKPSYESPMDSTRDILQRGITPINSNGGFWEDYLLNSVNAWEKLAGQTGITFSSGAQQEKLIRENVKREGSHASLENTEAIAYLTLTDPAYKVTATFDDESWIRIFSRPCHHLCSTSARSKSGRIIMVGFSGKAHTGRIRLELTFFNVLRYLHKRVPFNEMWTFQRVFSLD